MNLETVLVAETLLIVIVILILRSIDIVLNVEFNAVTHFSSLIEYLATNHVQQYGCSIVHIALL